MTGAAKGMVEDGNDVAVVVEVGRTKIAACLGVSSGKELIIPVWLREIVRSDGAKRGIDEVSFYLNIRKIHLASGHQQPAIDAILQDHGGHALPVLLSEAERELIVIDWLYRKDLFNNKHSLDDLTKRRGA